MRWQGKEGREDRGKGRKRRSDRDRGGEIYMYVSSKKRNQDRRTSLSVQVSLVSATVWVLLSPCNYIQEHTNLLALSQAPPSLSPLEVSNKELGAKLQTSQCN